MQDAQLVLKSLGGDSRSFGVLVQRHQGAVLGYARHRLGDPIAAQDVAQEVFVEAYCRLADLRHPEKLPAWLRGIALNYCRRWLRRRQNERRREDTAARDWPAALVLDPQTELEAGQRRAWVQALLDTLSEKNRLTARLYYLEELSYEEIARFLEVPISTVKGRLHKVRKKLKEEMIDMAKEAYAQDGAQEGFAAQVMKRVGVAEIGIGEGRGTVWFSTADDQVFALSLPREQARRLAAGPKPGRGTQTNEKGIALASAPEDLPVADQSPDIYGFIAQLKNHFDLEITSLVLDTEEGQARAEAVVGRGAGASRFSLAPSDAVSLAGRLDLPLHATSRALEAVSLASEVEPITPADAARHGATIAALGRFRRQVVIRALEEEVDRMGIAESDGALEVEFTKGERRWKIGGLGEIKFGQIRRDALFRLAEESGRLHAEIATGSFVLEPRLEGGALVVDIEPIEG